MKSTRVPSIGVADEKIGNSYLSFEEIGKLYVSLMEAKLSKDSSIIDESLLYYRFIEHVFDTTPYKEKAQNEKQTVVRTYSLDHQRKINDYLLRTRQEILKRNLSDTVIRCGDDDMIDYAMQIEIEFFDIVHKFFYCKYAVLDLYQPISSYRPDEWTITGDFDEMIKDHCNKTKSYVLDDNEGVCEKRRVIARITLSTFVSGEVEIDIHINKVFDTAFKNILRILGFPFLYGIDYLGSFRIGIQDNQFLKDFLDKLALIEPAINGIKEDIIHDVRPHLQEKSLKGWLKYNREYTNKSCLNQSPVVSLRVNASNKKVTICVLEKFRLQIIEPLKSAGFETVGSNDTGFSKMAFNVPNIDSLKKFISIIGKVDPSVLDIKDDVLSIYDPHYFVKSSFLMGLHAKAGAGSSISIFKNNHLAELKLVKEIFSYVDDAKKITP